MGGEDGWTTHISRKSRRQKSWLSQPETFGGRMPGGPTAQRGGQRPLPVWLRRNYEPPPPPWMAGDAGKGGGKQDKDEKIWCLNPRCPGIGGKPSFKYLYRVGQGQYGFHCMACHTPWQRSWEAHLGGQPPPPGGPKGEDSTSTWAILAAGRVRPTVQRALPTTPWTTPTRSSWGRFCRCQMKLRGKLSWSATKAMTRSQEGDAGSLYCDDGHQTGRC